MIDVNFNAETKDFDVIDTVVYKTANLLKTQVGSLDYLKTFGIDLEMFLNPDVKIQLTTFKAYCIEQIGKNAINVLDLVETTESLQTLLDFIVGEVETRGNLTI